MSKTNVFENDILKFTFNTTALADVGTTLYVGLHTAELPETATTQVESEASYTGYARIAARRDNTDFWTVTGNSVSPAAAISFGQNTAGANTITHWSIGKAASGHSAILYKGTVTPNITCVVGVTPRLASTSTITED
jgi:hypothetical protein